MMKRNNIYRILSLFTLLIVTFTFFFSFGAVKVSAAEGDTADDLREKMKELQEELSGIYQQINNAKDAAAAAKVKANTYAARAAIVKEQISVLNEQITSKREELAVKQRELDAKRREREETYELFKQRLRAMYMGNNITILSLILGSDTFSEFLVAAKVQATISKHDTELVDKLDRETKEIEAQAAVIEADVAELDENLATLDIKYEELAALYIEADAEMTEAEALQKASEEEYSTTKRELEETQEEWAELMGTGMEEYVGGYFAWPVPSCTHVSARYGWRTLRGQPNYHRGIDISGYKIYGKPVVASNTGKVVRVRYYTTGYGYHVMIDHGDNWWTVYGHMSAIAVEEGQWVFQGETIGYVGSTGNSTGPHLHFEIRMDGEKVDPLLYVVR